MGKCSWSETCAVKSFQVKTMSMLLSLSNACIPKREGVKMLVLATLLHLEAYVGLVSKWVSPMG